jgi:hypothetical protein
MAEGSRLAQLTCSRLPPLTKTAVLAATGGEENIEECLKDQKEQNHSSISSQQKEAQSTHLKTSVRNPTTIATIISGVQVARRGAIAVGYYWIGLVDVVVTSIFISGALIHHSKASLNGLVHLYSAHFAVMFLIRGIHFF